MAIKIQGNGGTTADVDGTNFRALRSVNRPTDHGTAGAYTYGGFTGILPAALASNSEIFQFRWNEAARLCVINEIKLSACVTTTFFAAGVPVQIDLCKVTGWSAAGSGGTRPTIAALMKKRTSMPSSLVNANDIGIATTAALTVGTKTIEATSLATIVAPGPITASLNGQIVAPGTTFWQSEVGDGQHPLVLANQEGFVIRSVAVPATGTWQVAITVDWTEVDAY